MALANCPNCGCAPVDCTIVTVNPFADLDAFTQIGTVTIASGAAVLETGEGLVTIAGSTNFYDPVIFRITASTAGASGTIRLVVAYLDADNYLFGEFSFSGSSGTLRLGIREGGVETWLTDAVTVEDTADLGDSTDFSLCWVPGEVQSGGAYFVVCEALTKSGVGSWDDPPTTYTMLANTTTDAVTYEDYPCLSLPPGSTIDDIYVEIEAVIDMATDVRLLDIYLEIGGVQIGNRTPNAAVGTTLSAVGDGGTLTDWGVAAGDLTWENINVLAVAFTFRGGADAGGTQLSIADSTINVEFTTPDRQPGRLTLSRGNVTAVTVDCAREFSAEAPGEGKKAMVLSGAGEWSVASLDYSYHLSASKPSCPSCACTTDSPESCVCCDVDYPPAMEYVIDLGVGGWTDDICGFCDTVAGEYLLTADRSCGWSYVEEAECPANAGGLCYPRVLEFNLRLESDGESCKWVFVLWTAAVCSPDQSILSGIAVYESAALATSQDCQLLPVTLSKTIDVNEVCGGNLPATITLEAA